MKTDQKDMEGRKPEAQNEVDFKGYTLQELQYQRALLLVKREFLRDKALKESARIKQQIPILNGKSALSNITAKGILGKIVHGLDFADYILLGLQTFRIGKKALKFFKR